jgi:rubrerythrin
VSERTDEMIEVLREGRRRERGQTGFYRALAAAAEEAGEAAQVERLNELLADEQHHFSRLTARLMELGDAPPDLPSVPVSAKLPGWEAEARAREAGEVAFYKSVLSRRMDDKTRAMLQEILHSERQHRERLAGKWMSA